MKVVWSPTISQTSPKIPYYKNVWFIPSDHEVWMEPDRYDSIDHAMESDETQNCIRIAILELND